MVTRKKTKNGILTRKHLEATELKLGMHIQFHSGSNIGLVAPGQISSFPCVRPKMPKIVFQQRH